VRSDFDEREPENRLVARTLERKLEDTLAAVARELLAWVIVRGWSGRGS
jgi:hypothetical protein